ncbi:MAG: pentapeptide repeat-containing protein [Pleurocapsa minor HA4230-MV1]|jgi:uncharacterized protein YjbI with pentapeptide repeats|nr:pentapeptide repeat-containing protein [Pleurocapsa minor HA4230-MV1]
MTTSNTKQIISTDKFNQLLSIIDPKEREILEILIGSDLTQVKFSSPAYLGGFNLSDAVLENLDLISCQIYNCNLTRASLRNSKLYKANIRKNDLTDSNFTKADLTQARFDESQLVNTNFEQAILEGADFSQVKLLKNVSFRQANLSKSNLRGYDAREPKVYLDLSSSDLKEANLKGALYDSHTIFPKGFDPQAAGAYFITAGVSLSNTDLSFTNLAEAHLSGADLSGANLTGARIASANLNGANLTEVTLSYEKARFDRDLYANVHLEGAILHRATIIGIKPDNTCMNLDGIDLTEARIIDCSFTYCDMNGAKLINLRLDGTDFHDAKLRGANFANSSLRGCNFSRADLRGVNFENADLSGASLFDANLTNTDLSKANLNGVDLSKTILDNTKLPV